MPFAKLAANGSGVKTTSHGGPRVPALLSSNRPPPPKEHSCLVAAAAVSRTLPLSATAAADERAGAGGAPRGETGPRQRPVFPHVRQMRGHRAWLPGRLRSAQSSHEAPRAYDGRVIEALMTRDRSRTESDRRRLWRSLHLAVIHAAVRKVPGARSVCVPALPLSRTPPAGTGWLRSECRWPKGSGNRDPDASPVLASDRLASGGAERTAAAAADLPGIQSGGPCKGPPVAEVDAPVALEHADQRATGRRRPKPVVIGNS